MAGRGGRGQAILEALKKCRIGEEQTPGQSSAAPHQPPQPGPSGRAALLGLLGRSGRAGDPSSAPSVESTSSPPASSASVPAAGGVGRASFLSSLRSQESRSFGSPVPEVESKVSSSEGKSVASDDSYGAAPVKRHGTVGKNVKLCNATANYVRLECDPLKGVFEYEVRFNPEVDSKGFRRKMLNTKRAELGGVRDFDGARALYLPIKLPDKITTYQVVHPSTSETVEMKVIFKKKKNMADNIHFFNVLFGRIFKILKMVRLGRDYYNSNTPTDIPQHRLEVWPGYVTAVDEYEGGIMLSIDASHRVLRTLTCLEVIKQGARNNQGNYRDEAMKMLVGASVLTRYNNKMYHIDDILWDQNPESTFDARDAKISYIDYYKNQYGLEITDKKQPLLLNRFKKKLPGKENETLLICLIPELCFMTGLTDEQRADFRLMKDLATHTRITPDQRKRALKKFIDSVNGQEEARKCLSDWGLRMENETVKLESRVFPSEVIVYGRKREITCRDASWSSDATRNSVLHAVHIQRWVIVFTQRNERVASDFTLTLKKVSPQMGIDVAQPHIVQLDDDRTDTFVKKIRENIRDDVQIIVIICPTSRDDRYAAIKKICCVERPVASQVINARTLDPKKLNSVVQKVALQMNCKLGGSLWTVKIPIEKLMVCGIDSYHGGAGSKNQSVGAFVASLNPSFSRWYSKVCFQTRGQELVDGLKVCFISALKKYYDVNGEFPDKIIVYRDGVGDGQLKVCRDYEVPQFEACFGHVHPDYKPKLSLVVVQKRINTRIFDVSSGREENPTPGTVVDHTVTRRNWYDFFLISQLVRQGTVSPTHYVVVKDGCDLKVDHMQRLTYKMTHMYYNWPGTVRVPAPCQYAHKLAYLVGQNIQKSPSDALSDRLFFL